jgi:hypothetical protein
MYVKSFPRPVEGWTLANEQADLGLVAPRHPPLALLLAFPQNSELVDDFDGWAVPEIVPASRQNRAWKAKQQPSRLIGETDKRKDLRENSKVAER